MEEINEKDIINLLQEIELEEEISRLREEVWKLRVKNKRLEFLVEDLKDELGKDKQASCRSMYFY